MGLKSFIKQTGFYQKILLPYRVRMQKALSDEDYFIKMYRSIFGYKPNFRNPETFNEKIIHRILFDRKPIYTALADKLKVRIYADFMLKNALDSAKTGGGGNP